MLVVGWLGADMMVVMHRNLHKDWFLLIRSLANTHTRHEFRDDSVWFEDGFQAAECQRVIWSTTAAFTRDSSREILGQD